MWGWGVGTRGGGVGFVDMRGYAIYMYTSLFGTKQSWNVLIRDIAGM